MEKLLLISGSGNKQLAKKIANILNVKLARVVISRFSDKEFFIEILEELQGKNVFIIQSLFTPIHDNIMELILLGDTVYRAAPFCITAVIPYFSYARQDRCNYLTNTPISAKVIAELFTIAKINRVITLDLHSEQMQGFFAMPINVYSGLELLLKYVMRLGYVNFIIVSPDLGGINRARVVSQQVGGIEIAIIDKFRNINNEIINMQLFGDVCGKHCIIVDDLVDTGDTVCNAARLLKEYNAATVIACCVHPVLSGDAIKNINDSKLDLLVVSDSLALDTDVKRCSKIKQVSIAKIFGKAIRDFI